MRRRGRHPPGADGQEASSDGSPLRRMAMMRLHHSNSGGGVMVGTGRVGNWDAHF